MARPTHLILTVLLFAWGTASAAPPLTEAQRAQLATATDQSLQLDEGALYALLANTLDWTPGDEAGAMIPDYDAIGAAPQGARGQVYLLEGEFAGRARPYHLARSGPWGRSLTEWVVRVQAGSTPQQDKVAVVYFVDPQGVMLKAPRRGTQVRVAGRFYKVWRDRDMNNAETDYLTFVARAAHVIQTPAASTSTTRLPLLILIILIAGAGFVFMMRMRMGPRKPPSVRARELRRERHLEPLDHDGLEAIDEEPLPSDPVDALASMGKQHRAE